MYHQQSREHSDEDSDQQVVELQPDAVFHPQVLNPTPEDEDEQHPPPDPHPEEQESREPVEPQPEPAPPALEAKLVDHKSEPSKPTDDVYIQMHRKLVENFFEHRI